MGGREITKIRIGRGRRIERRIEVAEMGGMGGIGMTGIRVTETERRIGRRTV